MSGEVVAINASLLAVYDQTQRKKEAFVTSNRVEFELTPGLSLALPCRITDGLPDPDMIAKASGLSPRDHSM